MTTIKKATMRRPRTPMIEAATEAAAAEATTVEAAIVVDPPCKVNMTVDFNVAATVVAEEVAVVASR
jgi:hypothetical protein